MQKNLPIIFQVKTDENPVVFSIPDNNYFNENETQLVDRKINSEWQRGVKPKDFKAELFPNKTYTILIKPANDEYFAG